MAIDISNIKPLRPYLLRAHYDWLCDNQLTPFLLIDTTYPGADVPFELAKNGEIVFNIAPQALSHLSLGNDIITFSASFSGKPRNVSIPLGAVIAIYAKENNMGIGFPSEEYYDKERQHQENKQTLQIVDDQKGLDEEPTSTKENVAKPKKRSANKKAEEVSETDKNKPKKGAHLRIID